MKRQSRLLARVPSFESVSPEYAGLVAKRGDLAEQKDKLREQFVALCDKARSSMIRGIPTSDLPTAEAIAKQARVAKLIGVEPPAPVVRERPEELDAIDQLNRDRSDVDEALAEIERRLTLLRRELSPTICETIRSDFEAGQKRLVDAALALFTEAEEYCALADGFSAIGLSWGELNPLPRTQVETLSATGGRLGSLLIDALNAGRLTRSALPKRLG